MNLESEKSGILFWLTNNKLHWYTKNLISPRSMALGLIIWVNDM